MPERTSYGDVVLLGVATHKLGRIITKDWVTSPLRAPFTEYQQSAGGGEVNEKSIGEGLQRAVGDLLYVSVVHRTMGRQRFGFRLRFQTARDRLHLQYLHSGHDFRFSSASIEHRKGEKVSSSVDKAIKRGAV